MLYTVIIHNYIHDIHSYTHDIHNYTRDIHNYTHDIYNIKICFCLHDAKKIREIFQTT